MDGPIAREPCIHQAWMVRGTLLNCKSFKAMAAAVVLSYLSPLVLLRLVLQPALSQTTHTALITTVFAKEESAMV